MAGDKAGFPRILKIGLPFAISALLLAGFFTWNYNVERSLHLCLRCGRQVILRKRLFSFGQAVFYKEERVEKERPSILEKVLDYQEECDHGLPASNKPWIFNGEEEAGDRSFLLPVDGYVEGIFGDFREHWTGIGHEYNIFMPGFEVRVPYDRQWKLRFGKSLEDRVKSDPTFAEHFRADLRTRRISEPGSFVKSVIDTYETSGTTTK